MSLDHPIFPDTLEMKVPAADVKGYRRGTRVDLGYYYNVEKNPIGMYRIKHRKTNFKKKPPETTLSLEMVREGDINSMILDAGLKKMREYQTIFGTGIMRKRRKRRPTAEVVMLAAKARGIKRGDVMKVTATPDPLNQAGKYRIYRRKTDKTAEPRQTTLFMRRLK